jgi:WD40 repeat protein
VRWYRDLRRWLHDNQGRPEAKTAVAELAQRSPGGKLVPELTLTHEESPIIVHFISDRWLAVLSGTIVWLVDLEGEAHVAEAIWDDRGRRPWAIASRQLGPGRWEVFFAGSDSIYREVFDESAPRPRPPTPPLVVFPWQTFGGTPLHEDAQLRALALSPDGQRLVTGGDWGHARLYHLADGGRIESSVEVKPHDTPVMSAAFSSDGKLLVTGTNRNSIEDPHDPCVLVWDGETGAGPKRTISLIATASCVAAAPDARSVAFATQGVRVWKDDPASSDPVALEEGKLFASVALRGSRLWGVTNGRVGGNAIHVWELAGDEWKPVGKPRDLGSLRMNSVELSPDGAILAVGGQNGTLELWPADW